MSAAASRADGSRFDPRWLVLSVTTIGSFMSILDSTIVNVALPSVLREFNENLERGQLVLTGYLLALAAVIPLSGFLGERLGLKRVYMVTLAFFTIGSAFCGLSWNLSSLIGFRVIQGLGGGMLQPLGMALVFTTITPLERGKFMGMLGLPMLLAPLLGPTLGGYLAEYVSWRMIFLINLPIGAVNLVLAHILLKERPRRHDARFDRTGFMLTLCAFPGILLALSEGSHYGWGSPLVLGLLAFGLCSLAVLILYERRKDDPLLQVRLFANPMFSLAMSINFVTQFSLFGIQYLLPLFLQQERGLGAAQTGLILLPSGFTSFAMMNTSGRLYNRVGPRRLAVTGLSVLMVTTFLLSRSTASTSLVWIAFVASMRGVAMGLCMMPVQTAAYNTVPQALMTRATSMVNMLFRIFGSTSTAMLTAVLVLSLRFHGAPAGSSVTNRATPVEFLSFAFDDAFKVMALMTIVGICLSLGLRDRVIEDLRKRVKSPVSEREAAVAGD